MIKIEGVTKVYRKGSPPAVDGLTLDMNDGEVLGLVGLNGAGKTTTIRMSSGITLPTSGKILVDGFDIVREKVRASRNVGWIPEFPNFEPNAKPLTLLKYFAGFYGLGGREAEDKALELLRMVGLEKAMDKKLRSYSQGMKKRFSIAETLIGDPKNVLFDETLNGLDPQGVIFVRKMIGRLRSEGKAILLSSHILTEIEDSADRVAIINRGKLVKLLDRSELKYLGKTQVKITVDNPDGPIEGVLSQFGETERRGNEFLVRDLKVNSDRIPDILEALVGKGYRVREFTSFGESLEQYFFDLIGGSK
ncbi:ABC transporter ATP-binding protein [Thermogymnomonas acidicola]|uniref:ABC transporter ATP-binding protein n=1 Tax=Thermogymnomonas acidicola TaxID=399579 RepID=A0AA37FA87_9ARCH|nr:ABC transporter ATP-binding protein [Thermogymnomonas acidicola]GGM78520.1 ABC transporter ATP-binding protein [Thermogymnomonas acidicola]